MKLNIRNLLGRKSKTDATYEGPAPKPKGLTPQEVWESPALHPRRVRRWAKLWGSIWKWDQQALGLPADLPSRFTRRHFDQQKFLFPKTRRQRRVKAHIMRDARARGVTR